MGGWGGGVEGGGGRENWDLKRRTESSKGLSLMKIRVDGSYLMAVVDGLKKGGNWRKRKKTKQGGGR